MRRIGSLRIGGNIDSDHYPVEVEIDVKRRDGRKEQKKKRRKDVRGTRKEERSLRES